MHTVLLMLALPFVGAEPDLSPGTQLNYQGTLAPADPQPEATARKQFDVTCWIRKAGAGDVQFFWLLDERGRGEWPWFERFGVVTVDRQGRATGDFPTLLYDRPEAKGPLGVTPPGKDAVALPLPLVRTDKTLAVDVEWQNERLAFHVDQTEKRGERAVWRISLRDQFGPKGTLWLDQQQPLVAAVQQRVILGRGDEYVLKMELVGSEQLAPPALAAYSRAFDALAALRAKLPRPRASQEIDWKPDELAVLETALPDAQRAAAGTVLEKLLASAHRDLKLQAGRTDALATLSSEYLGKAVGEFSIRGFGDESLTAADLGGNVTVLHFWDYRDEPLKEPYGQVGYLDFIYHRRKASGVRVYGVAVDGRLADAKIRPAAERGVRKLKEFMNLSYPVLLDEGGLLKKFGDPRVLGGALPLFVVIGRDGKISHYHVGHYEVHQDQGLKELDDAVQQARNAESATRNGDNP
jgi:hypothetical protein